MLSLHQLTENVKLLQKTAIVVEDKILILKRAVGDGYRAEKWDLPGGNVEWPEIEASERDLHQAEIVREISEETGISLLPNQFQAPVYMGTYFEKEKELYTIIVGWSVRITERPSVSLSPEHSEFTWISREQLDSYDFGFAGEKEGFIRRTIEASFTH